MQRERPQIPPQPEPPRAPRRPPAVGFPASPWSLSGQMHLSLWRVARGVVATAFVDYQPGGVLTYSELLRARPTRTGLRAGVTITDIWVDSPASRDGGRALWAIPKGLAEFTVQPGPAFRRAAGHDGGALAYAEFVPGRGFSRRLPFRSSTVQQREDGSQVVAPMKGTARMRLARATWEFGADGPFADLRDRRPLASVVLEDFDLTFGGH